MITTRTVTITGPTKTVTVGDIEGGIGGDGRWAGYTLSRFVMDPAARRVDVDDMPFADGGVIRLGPLGVRHFEMEGTVGADTAAALNTLCRELAEAAGWVGATVREPVELRWTPESTELMIRGVVELLEWGEPSATTVSFRIAGVTMTPAAVDPVAKVVALSQSATPVARLGNARVWPVVTITAPSSGTTTGVRVRNTTTGEQVSLSGLSFSSGEIVIDTTPGLETVEQNGVSIVARRTAGERWLSLVPGSNTLQIVVTGGSSSGVAGHIEFRDGWIT